jgi:hypothetical protein
MELHPQRLQPPQSSILKKPASQQLLPCNLNRPLAYACQKAPIHNLGAPFLMNDQEAAPQEYALCEAWREANPELWQYVAEFRLIFTTRQQAHGLDAAEAFLVMQGVILELQKGLAIGKRLLAEGLIQNKHRDQYQ